jgi:diguanylate cyclase (GGDEF)-like protein
MYEHEKLLSRTDHLTGLLNSRSFYDVAQNYLCIMKRRQAPFAVAFLDLDNFKTINDEYGHDVGDTVLKDFADSITSTIRNTDKAARLGGDEFVIFFPDTTAESISLIMDKIIDAIDQRMQAFNYNLSFSAGVVCCLESKQSLDELITAADKLMYEVKNSGKGSFRYKEVSS